MALNKAIAAVLLLLAASAASAQSDLPPELVDMLASRGISADALLERAGDVAANDSSTFPVCAPHKTAAVELASNTNVLVAFLNQTTNVPYTPPKPGKPGSGVATGNTATRYCFRATHTETGCDVKTSRCCSTGAPEKVALNKEIHIFPDRRCIDTKENLASFKGFHWTTSNTLRVAKPKYPKCGKSAMHPYFVRLAQPWRTDTDFCVDIPDGTKNPCKNIHDLCGVAGCTTMVITKGYDAHKKSGKVYTCKAAELTLFGSRPSNSSSAGGGSSGGGSSGGGSSGGGSSGGGSSGGGSSGGGSGSGSGGYTTPAAGFNATACLAKPLTDYAKGWVDVHLTTSDCLDVVRLNGLTCNDVCARRGMKCDPCAISKLNCQDAFKYAATQTRMSAIDQAAVLGGWGSTDSAILSPTPGCTTTACVGPWPQSTCATSSQPTGSVSNPIDYHSTRFHAGLTTKIFVGDESDCLVAGFAIMGPYNWYNPSAAYYLDPADACNQVIARVEPGRFVSLYYGGAFCYCYP